MPFREFGWLLEGLSEQSAYRLAVGGQPEEVTGEEARSLIASL